MHIVIVNRWPRFHDGQRWDNELTRYEAFFDHQAHRISYVVDGPGALGVLAPREQIAHLVQVEDVNQYSQLLAAVTEVSERVGPVDLLIALSEFTLEIAAQVRQALNIPGHGPDEVAVYRDKARMKQVLQEHGLAVPAFTQREPGPHLTFAAKTGYPLIVKPVDGAASIGVVRVDDERQLLAALDGVDLARHEVEAFVEGQVYHVDGYTDATGQVPFQAVSRYLNSCLTSPGASRWARCCCKPRRCVRASPTSAANACRRWGCATPPSTWNCSCARTAAWCFWRWARGSAAARCRT